MHLRANKISRKTGLTGREPLLRKHSDNAARPAGSSVDQVLFLHQTLGNQAVQRLFNAGVIQAKLKIGAPDDVYEQEADRVAEQVMRMPENEAVSYQLSATRQKDESVRMKPG